MKTAVLIFMTTMCVISFFAWVSSVDSRKSGEAIGWFITFVVCLLFVSLAAGGFLGE